MGSNSGDNTEKSKIGFWELLREIGKRLKDEILLLAFLFALLVAYTAISIQQFSVSIGGTFIVLYLIATVCYLALKLRKTSSDVHEESKEYIQWRLGYPAAFQNPHALLKESLEQGKPLEEIVHFDFDLELTNLSAKSIKASVYVKSPTQAVVFVWDEPIKMWKRRLGIIPYRENVEFALDNADTCSIGSHHKGKFLFHGWYRPHFAHRDFGMRGKIVIMYRIYAKSEVPNDGTYFDTGVRKILIPFKDSVKYSKIGD